MFENSDFSKLLKSAEPLKLYDVLESASITVNEEGTTAAVASGKFIYLPFKN